MPRYKSSRKLRGVALAGALLVGLALPAAAQLPEEAEPQLAEAHTTATLEPAGAHRVYVVDPVFPHLIAAKTYIIDGDRRAVIGMLNAGYVPNFVPAPDHSELYIAETFWSRGTRGERTDVVSFFDARTLDPTGEVVLPNGRFLVVSKKHNAGVTPDGRYFLSFNMAPATTVSIIDVKSRTYLADVETPGCALVFPSAPRRFSMICANGSLRTVSFDEEGKAESVLSQSFFDAQQDPVFEHPAFLTRRARAYFVSYGGKVYRADLAAPEPSFEGPWSSVGESDREEGWRPGGWQPVTWHGPRGRLFLLMHRGPEWTHKQAGTEVWVFDIEKRKRIARISLEHPSVSIAVSQDGSPQLYALSESATLAIYDVGSGRQLGSVDELGSSPLVLHVYGE